MVVAAAPHLKVLRVLGADTFFDAAAQALADAKAAFAASAGASRS